MTREEIEKKVDDMNAFNQKLRSLYTVNCWHKSAFENALMWKAYSNANSGVMISTSYEKLIDAFTQAPHKLNASEVRYYDFENDRKIPWGNSNFLVTHKQRFYWPEQEVRVIHQVENHLWVHDWAQEESQFGIYVPIDLDALVIEIKVAPFAPKWHLDVVKSACVKYGLTKPVSKSSLSM